MTEHIVRHMSLDVAERLLEIIEDTFAYQNDKDYPITPTLECFINGIENGYALIYDNRCVCFAGDGLTFGIPFDSDTEIPLVAKIYYGDVSCFDSVTKSPLKGVWVKEFLNVQFRDAANFIFNFLKGDIR